MKHHGISQPRSLNAKAAESGSFGRMFEELPRLISNPQELIKIGEKNGVMDEKGSPQFSKTVPLGHVFLGQFIDHDITLDVTSNLGKVNTEVAIKNVRTPALDLDCIYGSGPEASPHLYYQHPENPTKYQELIGGHHLLTNIDDLARAPSGSEDNLRRAAIIGDPRNDENRMVSQIQLTMHYFHNAVFDHLCVKYGILADVDGGEPEVISNAKSENTSLSEIFEEAQRLTRWHYQWVVVNDFLVKMVGKEIVNDILSNGTKFYRVEGEPYVPVEFSAAAYRFGHTMVTKTLKYNDGLGEVSLFGPELGKGFRVNKAGFADMTKFFGKDAQAAGAVDIKLQSDLLELPFMSAGTSAAEKSLATRNLLRGQSFGLPSGQNIKRYMEDVTGTEIQSPDVVLSQLKLPEFEDTNIDSATPLWLYILAEGSLNDGNHLGPVGGRIVAETIIGLLESDSSSYLGANRSWFPELGVDGQAWAMEDLIEFSQKAIGDSIVVYEHKDFAGASRTITSDCPWVGNGWNDRISSIVVNSGTWRIFEHKDYKGKCKDLKPGRYSWIKDAGFANDSISSLKPI